MPAGLPPARVAAYAAGEVRTSDATAEPRGALTRDVFVGGLFQRLAVEEHSMAAVAAARRRNGETKYAGTASRETTFIT